VHRASKEFWNTEDVVDEQLFEFLITTRGKSMKGGLEQLANIRIVLEKGKVPMHQLLAFRLIA
jgi:biotin synthase-related radical SAM superfamily protein